MVNNWNNNISGWWFGTFFHMLGIIIIIIPTDELIFFRGVGQPPTRDGAVEKHLLSCGGDLLSMLGSV